MKKTTLLLLVLSLISGFLSFQKGHDNAGLYTAFDADEVYEGEVFIKFKPSFSTKFNGTKSEDTTLNELFDRFQVDEIRPFLKGRSLKSTLKGGAILNQVFVLEFDKSINPFVVAKGVSLHPEVAYAEPRFARKLAVSPNDSSYPNMNWFSLVEAEEAWDIVKGEDGDVVIAVVDGGTDWDHVDLIDNIYVNPGEIADNGIDDDGNGYIDDVRGWNFQANSNDPTGSSQTAGNASHGTHVTGTAGASTNNDRGVASLSWNPKIMPINVASRTVDLTIFFGYEGIVYAIENGADIINCSWGSGAFSQLEQDIIDIGIENGVLVIGAAGNDGTNNDLDSHYPSDLKGVLSVGSTLNNSGGKSNFSNYGASVDVFAPGSSILSTYPNNNYTSISGTSMATPMVSALAALVKTQNPSFTAHQLREQLRVTSDNIDGDNATFLSGFLGKGRINARRALTEFNHPAIRIDKVSFVDAGNDGIIDAGEEVDVTISFINYLAQAENTEAILATEDPNITILSSTSTMGTLGTDQTKEVSFRFKTTTNLPDGYKLLLYTNISAENYTDRDIVNLTVTPPRFVTHKTPHIEASVTTKGNIGYNGFQDDLNGNGFKLNGADMLFEGSFMIGTDASRISDGVRGADGQTQDNDFQPVRGESLVIRSPGDNFKEEGYVLLSDSIATNPLYITVEQESYTDDATGNEHILFLKYTIKNNHPQALRNLHAGIFMDWDIGAQANDFARFDATRRLGYMMDKSSGATKFAATKLLMNTTELDFRAIHNPNEIYNGYTNMEKWDHLSGGVQTTSLDNVDISTLLGMKVPDIESGASVVLGFAIIGATSLPDLQTYSDTAQMLWDTIIYPTEPIPNEPTPDPFQFTLAQNFPNPFNPSTTINFEIPTASFVKLNVYNLLGQKVKTLLNHREIAGYKSLTWDGKLENGNFAPSGTYLYVLEMDEGKQVRRITRKMQLLK